MNMTSILTRAAILTVFGVGVSIAMINRVEHLNSATPVAHQLAPTRAAVTSVASATTIFELPTVDVRPSAADFAEAARESDRREVASAHAVTVVDHPQFIHALAPTLPTLGLDMPYYSFGKALPRVSKE